MVPVLAVLVLVALTIGGAVAWRRRRFRFDVFFVRMWLFPAFDRFTFPVPVIEKRFLAPRWLFIFGIVCLY